MPKQPATPPLTKDYFAAFYSENPLAPVSDDVVRLQEQLDRTCAELDTSTSKDKATSAELPTRLDDNFFRWRQFCEEVVHSLSAGSGPMLQPLRQDVEALLLATEAHIRGVQDLNRAKIRTAVKHFLPGGMRGAILERNQAGKAKQEQQQIEKLVKQGGTIKQKYDLLLKHQHEKREELAKIGDSHGMFKMLIRFVGGVPQHLLSFLQQINSPSGPMEEQRLQYGPEMYKVTKLGSTLAPSLALIAAASSSGSIAEDHRAAFTSAVQCFCTEAQRIVTFIGEVFDKSPFLKLDQNIARTSSKELTSADLERVNSGGAERVNSGSSAGGELLASHAARTASSEIRASLCEKGAIDGTPKASKLANLVTSTL